MIKDIPIRYVKGVGPKKEIVFNNLGIRTIRGMLYYFPFRYEDRRNFKKINELKENEFAAVKGKVLVRNIKKFPYFARTKRVKSIFEIILEDESGRVNCIWFNQPYLFDLIETNNELLIYGKPSLSSGRLTFISPDYFNIDQSKKDNEEYNFNIGKIVGVYHLSTYLNQKFIRKIIFSSLNNTKKEIDDPVPFYIRKERGIINVVQGLEGIHFPKDWQEIAKARERFIFEELFFSQILVYLRKAKHRLQKSISFQINNGILQKIKDNLSFTLTASQEESINQIINDLKKPYPMHRLLQGDVGCGKTVVAAFSIGICGSCGWQTAFMVPTEILAYQHKETLENILSGLGLSIEVLTSSTSLKDAKKIYSALKDGEIDIVIGTHTLLEENVLFKNLGLVIIDEQHKFGVAQRALLPRKSKINPHCLVMSATPIPRSLALALYGDLDITVIKQLPKDRLPPQTMWLQEGKREWVYDFLRNKLQEGRQVYIVYPVIEESETEDLKSLEDMTIQLKQKLAEFSVEMFHGEMKVKEKRDVIKKFKEKMINVLVSTTIVEVGVDIENATVMIVENPEKFGLAQLHQLRGRIQRSHYQPFFILLSKNTLSDIAIRRLEIISHTNDGFKIAEEDLKLRGPGDFFGHLQHGLPNLKIADPLRDLQLLSQARVSAYKVIKNDPYLEKPEHRPIREHLDFWFNPAIKHSDREDKLCLQATN